MKKKVDEFWKLLGWVSDFFRNFTVIFLCYISHVLLAFGSLWSIKIQNVVWKSWWILEIAWWVLTVISMLC